MISCTKNKKILTTLPINDMVNIMAEKIFTDEEIKELARNGTSPTQVSKLVGCSPSVICNSIKRLEEEQGWVDTFRKREGHLLARAKAKALTLIEQHIENGRFEPQDLVKAYDTISKHEALRNGNPTEIKGLVGYIVHMEEEQDSMRPVDLPLEHQEPIDLDENTGMPKFHS